MSLIRIPEAAGLLTAADNILIVTHIRPDGDTAGSACALCLGLRGLGKTTYLAKNPASMVRYTGYLDPYFAPTDFTPGFIVAVDIAGAGQYPPGWEPLAERTDLAVDHHGTNSGYARFTVLDDHAAAAGELIYELLKVMDVPLTAPVAEALYVAIATDTNGFRTAGTTKRTLSVAADLHDRGFDVFSLTKALFETKTAARLRLESYLYGTMDFPAPGVCRMVLPYETVLSCGAAENDMDKISLLTMVPEGVRAGFMLRQLADGSWKISLRTDGTIHAGQLLKSAVGGGGHPDAAGAVSREDPDILSEKIQAELSRFYAD